jgi:hypothetical protein
MGYKTLRLIALSGVVFGLLASIGFAEERSTAYDYWMTLKPGSFITFQCRSSGAGGSREWRMTFTLKQVTPQAVVIDYRKPYPAGAKPTAQQRDVLPGRQFTFEPHDVPEESPNLFAAHFDFNPYAYLQTSAETTLAETPEDITVKNNKIRVARAESRFGTDAVRTTITIWRSEDVPGRIVKCLRRTEGATALMSEYEAVDFLMVKADPAEIARLRAERKPVAVEVSGTAFIFERFRFFKDLEAALSPMKQLQTMLQNIGPENPNIDWLVIAKAGEESLTAARLLKNHLDEDLSNSERTLEAKEFDKLRPFLNQTTLLASLILNIGDLLGRFSAAAPNPPLLADAYAVQQEVANSRDEFLAVNRKAQEEFKKLMAIKIAFIRKLP